MESASYKGTQNMLVCEAGTILAPFFTKDSVGLFRFWMEMYMCDDIWQFLGEKWLRLNIPFSNLLFWLSFAVMQFPKEISFKS